MTDPASNSSEPMWRICADTGGTFTDCIGVDPEGRSHRIKVLSDATLRCTITGQPSPEALGIDHAWPVVLHTLRGWSIRIPSAGDWSGVIERFEPATSTIRLAQPAPGLRPGCGALLSCDEGPVMLGVRLMTGAALGEPLPPMRLRIATTRGTNALLERRGSPTAFFVTRGFGDLLLIGDQRRPDLFALDIVRPPPLFEEAIETDERLDHAGRVLRAPDLDQIRRAASRLVERGIRSAAVALLHSDVNPDHERRVADALREGGMSHISVSSGIAPFIKLLSRAETAVVDAYLAPVIEEYLREVSQRLSDESALQVLTSAGSIVSAGSFRACESLLSGPAGGVVGAAAVAKRAGFSNVVSFDMGGTSTDVSRITGSPSHAFEHSVGDATLRTPAVRIKTVAAGGGSICSIRAGALSVGPDSAGANPGPACYAGGGPLTLTDVNLLLGRIDPTLFEIPIDPEPARRRLEELVRDVEEQQGARPEPDVLLRGLLDIANQRMADAIRRISVREGYDPAAHALVAFGGAGPQHACAVAERLGMRTAVIPPDASLLSAVGLADAPIERIAQRQILGPLREVEARLDELVRELESEAIEAATRQGAERGDVSITRRLAFMRFVGQEATVEVPFRAIEDMAPGFRERYEHLFGHLPAHRPVEVESLRVFASAGGGDVPLEPALPERVPQHVRTVRRACFSEGWREVEILRRESLSVGTEVRGPALITERRSVTVLQDGWVARVDRSGALVLTDNRRHPDARNLLEHESGAVEAELFTGRLTSIATDMGELLARTAISPNVRERLDFSCAILDADGLLTVNAPHIPVHLGALGVCVRSVVRACELRPGDVIITNHPGFGGSHLPDITLIAPVFHGDPRPAAFVACRAHHAEIGGVSPGSMPGEAASLAEEGCLIHPMHLVRAGRADWESIERLLASPPHPSRAVEENLADLRAQLACVLHGRDAVESLVRVNGPSRFAQRMSAVRERAASRTRETLAQLAPGRREAAERLDDGSMIRVAIEVHDAGAAIDFTGSAGVHPGGFNAPEAVTRSAVAYVLRLLVGEEMPLNDGLFEPVSLIIPSPGMLAPVFEGEATRCPAVAGGNVETSQRVVDTLIKALGLGACGQGTMNNITFGADEWGAYETVCGGAGATARRPGADAVHTHMTNTRITDAEVVERRFPVRIERFAIRRGSGGAGRHPGGDGVVREYTFLAPARLSILSQHRTEGPFGVEGGSPGAPGAQYLLRAGGAPVELPGCASAEMEPGDRFLLLTPGGGAWGRPE